MGAGKQSVLVQGTLDMLIQWRMTENNRRAKYYSLTTDGRATLRRETRDWRAQTAAILQASLGEL
jgi:DNA-binding PadR family transcriptional regulator